MKNRPTKKIKVMITDPWDSNEIIIGFFDRSILVDNLMSLLMHSEAGGWFALMPRYKGQQLINDMNSKQKFVVNILKLRDVELIEEKIEPDRILYYASGSAEI